MKRRQLIQTAVATGLLWPAALLPAPDGRLARTPGDYAGPFYPVGARNRTNDLITGPPRSDVLDLRGRVFDEFAAPRAGVLIDIWQADPEGRYKHPGDATPGERRQEFLYWGEAITDKDGRFRFRTYVPGEYAARPAEHIHYKVWAHRQLLLTSQIYFEELGGARGLARSDAAATLQTVNLHRVGEAKLQADVSIVV